jgi:Putative adhesin
MAATTSPETTGPLPLTRSRIAVLVIGAPLCLLLVAYTGLGLVAIIGEGRYPVSYTSPASAKSLTVTTAGGQLSIRPKAAGRATLAGTARYTFVRSTLTERTAGGDTAVGYHCVSLPVGSCALDATISAPAAMPVSASTGGGNGSVTGMLGPVALSSGGGSLSADHISGPLRLNTSGGNIQVTTITSPTMTASSGGGDIRAAGISSATITATTSGGNIQATGVGSTKVTASTGGGDIEIDFTSVPHDVRVDTSGGNITLVLPAVDTQYHVTAYTAGGTVSDTLPQSDSASDTITATSGGGDITIRRQ